MDHWLSAERTGESTSLTFRLSLVTVPSTRVTPEALPETAPVGKVLELLPWPKPGVHHLPQTASAARVSSLTGSCLCSYLVHILHYFRLLKRSWPGSPVLKACPLFLSTALP